MITYQFYISRDGGAERQIDVAFTDQHTRLWNREKGRAFLRPQIGQPLVFYPGKGWEEVNAGSTESEWKLRITRKDRTGTSLFFAGTFTWSDCDFNDDLKRTEVGLQVDDEYRLLIDRLANEYDFIKLGAPPVSVIFERKPLVQIQFEHRPDVLHLTGSGGYHRRIASPGTSYSMSGYKTLAIVPGPPTNSAVPSVYFGGYDYDILVDNSPGGSADETYYNQTSQARIDYNPSTNRYVATAPGVTSYASEPPTNGIVRFLDVNGNPAFQLISYTFRARILTDDPSFNGAPTQVLPDDDALIGTLSFKRAAPFNLSSLFIHTGSSTDQTDWGRIADDAAFGATLYHTRPTGNPIAVLPNAWPYCSLWFNWTTEDRAAFDALIAEDKVDDAYLLSSVLNVVVREASGGAVTHTDQDSTLLHGVDPITGDSGRKLLIVPKSNLTTRNYSQAATLGKVRTNQLLDLVKMVRNGWWHIEDGKLKIEHYRYYARGRSYAAERVGLDITGEVERHSGRPWSYFTNQYKFNPEQIPELIKFNQNGESTPAFTGTDIQVLSKFAKAGQNDDFPADGFAFDLDYVLSNTDSVDETGFVLLHCSYDQNLGAYRVVKTPVPLYETQQNGALAVPYIQANYFVDGLPAKVVKMNGNEVTAASVRRSKKQPAALPVPLDFDFSSLVRSGIGVGAVEAATQNILSGKTSLTLEYEP